uniref:Uncharacterized protein n=1 Tax=Spongospora subterranea TaxID=70186 RepID=A0A0H5R3H2_9EUKA|eukprot:CRZ08660.1 hypothetical protein [Spongospora subterranea]
MCCAVAGLHPDWLSGNSDIGRYSPSFALGNGRILAIFISCGKHPVSMMLLGIPSIPPADLLLAFLTALSSSPMVICAVGVSSRSFVILPGVARVPVFLFQTVRDLVHYRFLQISRRCFPSLLSLHW